MPSYVLTGAPGAGKTGVLRLLTLQRQSFVRAALGATVFSGRGMSGRGG
jgi:predicted ATPase